MDTLTIVLLSPFFIVFLVLIVLFRHPVPRYLKKDPLRNLQEEPCFSVKKAGWITYAEADGLPYPGSFDTTSRRHFDLNGAWRIRFDPEEKGKDNTWFQTDNPPKWKSCTVPSVFNPVKNKKTADYYGIVWYDLHFNPDEIMENRIYRLCFEGFLLRGEFWLNGERLGMKEGGYTPTFFDITEILRQGENRLVVRCDNRLTVRSLPPKNMKDHKPAWHPYGGIHRNVFIEELPGAYIVKSDIRFEREGSSSRLRADILIHGKTGIEGMQASLTLHLVDPRGETVHLKKERISLPADAPYPLTLGIPVEDPILWNREKPLLYTLTMDLSGDDISDTVSVKTGLRDISVSGGNLLVNKTPVYLKGISIQEDDPKTGASLSSRAISRDMNLISQLGADYVRFAHYPHSAEAMLSCRDKGLFFSLELPVFQAGIGFSSWYREKQKLGVFPVRQFGLRQTASRALMASARRQLIEIIEQNRNNPALLFYSLGSEWYDLGKPARRPLQYLKRIADIFDPARPVSAPAFTWNFAPFDRKRGSFHVSDIISVNSFYGWYYGNVRKIGPHIDSLHRRFPDKPVILSGFGADAVAGRHDEEPILSSRMTVSRSFSEEYQSDLVEAYVRTSRERTFVAGVSPWVFADYPSPLFPDSPVPGYNLKGILTAGRTKKKVFYTLRKLYTEQKS